MCPGTTSLPCLNSLSWCHSALLAVLPWRNDIKLTYYNTSSNQSSDNAVLTSKERKKIVHYHENIEDCTLYTTLLQGLQTAFALTRFPVSGPERVKISLRPFLVKISLRPFLVKISLRPFLVKILMRPFLVKIVMRPFLVKIVMRPFLVKISLRPFLVKISLHPFLVSFPS